MFFYSDRLAGRAENSNDLETKKLYGSLFIHEAFHLLGAIHSDLDLGAKEMKDPSTSQSAISSSNGISGFKRNNTTYAEISKSGKGTAAILNRRDKPQVQEQVGSLHTVHPKGKNGATE